MGIVEIFEECGDVERLAAFANRERKNHPLDTILDSLEGDIETKLIQTGKVDPAMAKEAAHILRDRIRTAVFKPWDHYPLKAWGDKLALLTHGEYENEDEFEARVDGFLTPIRDDLIAKGCPEDVASGWCDDIVNACCHRVLEITHASGTA